jgi:hypothetical protein
VNVSIHVAGTKNETAAELERVPAGSKLPVSASLGALSCLGVIAAQQMQQVRFPQARCAICRALVVYKKRERDTGLFAEQAGVVGVAQAYRSEVRSLILEGLLVLTQLRDVLAAEDSTPMAEENQHRGLCPPERAEPDLAAIGVRKNDSGQRFAERAGHRSTIRSSYIGSHRPSS